MQDDDIRGNQKQFQRLGVRQQPVESEDLQPLV